MSTTDKPAWKLSESAAKRVLHPLPIPTDCPYCQSPVKAVENKVIFRKPFGEWPYIYLCQNRECQAHVGMHPGTNIPLGTLANTATRKARVRAKDLFQGYLMGVCKMTRSEAYGWLAARLNIPVASCHFAWFDLNTCNMACYVLTEEKRKPAATGAQPGRAAIKS